MERTDLSHEFDTHNNKSLPAPKTADCIYCHETISLPKPGLPCRQRIIGFVEERGGVPKSVIEEQRLARSSYASKPGSGNLISAILNQMISDGVLIREHSGPQSYVRVAENGGDGKNTKYYSEELEKETIEEAKEMRNKPETEEAIDTVIEKNRELHERLVEGGDSLDDLFSEIAEHLRKKIKPLDDVTDIGTEWIEKQIRGAVGLEEEGTEYEVGDAVRLEEEETEYEVGDLVKLPGGYRWITRVVSEDSYYLLAPPDEERHSNFLLGGIEKIGSFKPTEEGLEKVPEWVRGELVIEDFGPSNDRIGLWVGTKFGEIDYDVIVENGEARPFGSENSIRTGIIIDYHQLAQQEE